MANLNDFTKKNPIFTGNTGIRIPVGTSADRDETANNAATFRYNQDIGGVEFYGPTGWVPLAAPPSISSVTPGTFNGESGTEFTINGANFTSDAQVYFVTANSTDLLASTVTYIGPGQLRATTPRNILVQEEPLDVRVVQSSGSATRLDIIDAGGLPIWVTTAGTLGSVFGANVVNVYVTATDPEEAAITYTISSGSLPDGLSLTSANGLIQGLANSVLANTTYNFTIKAADTVNNNTDRTFSYTIQNRAPVINTAAGSLGTFYSGNAVPSTTIDAYDPDGGQVQFQVSSGSLPDNTTLGLSTGTISGTPIIVTSNTTYTFEVSANDEGSLITSNTYSFTVLNRFPVWNTAAGSLADISDDQIDSYTPITVNAYDPDGEVVSYQLTTGSVPAGLTFVTANAAIAGVPESVESNTTSTFTVTASDGSNGTAREFTMTVRMPTDPFFANTVLLLHGDGTNGANNNVFRDSSTNNFAITRNGNTTQGSFSPFSKPDGRWGSYFNGTSDYLTLPDNAAFAWGSGDFTVEGWFYHTGQYGNYGYGDEYGFLWSQTYAGNNYFVISLGTPTNRVVGFSYSTGSMTGPSWEPNRWNHFAVVRNSGVVNIYVNGSPGTPVSVGTNWTASYVPTISRYTHTSGWFVSAYFSNWRAVKGTAVYTSAFTPPTEPLTAIANTSALLFQSNTFRDNSVNNFTVTPIGPDITPFSPFASNSAYSSSVNGGSGYFDGSGDYLTVPDNGDLDLGTGNFCVEFWWYPQSTAAAQYPLIGDSTGNWYVIWESSNISLGRRAQGNDVSTTGFTLIQNAWQHICVTRQSTGTNDTRIFVNGVLRGVGTSTQNYAITNTLAIGSTQSATNPITGYLSNVRVIKGSVPAEYQTASTTTGTSIFTPPTEPLTAVANTSLLTNFTNAGIFDNTGFNNLETVGNAQIDTSVKKYGTGSMYFDGTGDYLFIRQPDAGLYIGTADVTIEAWVYWTGSGREVVMRSAGGNFGFKITSNYIGWGTYSWNVTTYTTNTWLHICIQRQGSTCKYFVNGSLVQDMGSGAAGVSLNIFAADTWSPGLIIGKEPSNSVEDWTGYIDEVRITKAIRYDMAGFTPRSKAFPNL